MANVVWHVQLGVKLYLDREHLGPYGRPGLWEEIYAQDRADAGIRVSQRGRLQCGGICRDRGVVAWMYLRERNGRPEAVHEHAEDEARHARQPNSDVHKAYQERIVRTSESAGFRANTEVHTPTGPRRGIRTDTLVEGHDGLRIGWEVQLSTVGKEGPRSVRARAAKALEHGITPAWHTDRSDYANRNDTQWTRSDRLPAYVIAKSGDLRVVSGFRALDFWRCDQRALYQCPKGRQAGCGDMHVTPKPRDIMFDDLVRKTAAGLIVPIEHHVGARVHRFWVGDQDYERYADLHGVPVRTVDPKEQAGRGSQGGPTCRPQVTLVSQQRKVLDWSDRSRWLEQAHPCRHCRKPAHLVDDYGVPCCKVCQEEIESAALGA
jgi:hypothetical protein